MFFAWSLISSARRPSSSLSLSDNNIGAYRWPAIEAEHRASGILSLPTRTTFSFLPKLASEILTDISIGPAFSSPSGMFGFSRLMLT